MKIGFFRALLGSCSGLAIFSELRKQSLVRTVCHLLLMSVISAVIIAAGIYPGLKNSLQSSMKVFAENCRGVVCTHKHIEPAFEPDKIRKFVLAGPLAVTYLPLQANSIPADFHQDCRHGMLWSSDGRFLLWTALSGDKYGVVPIWNPLARADSTVIIGTDALLAELKKTEPVTLALQEGEKEILSASKLAALAEFILIAGVAAYLLQKTLLEIIIYIGMFAVVTLLMNINRPHRLPFKELIVLAVYAGFPPMIIGSLAEALQLPFLNYNMIYVLGMTFYLIMIMNRLERLRQEQTWREQGQ